MNWLDELSTSSSYDGADLRELRVIQANVKAGGDAILAARLGRVVGRIAALLTWYGALKNQVGHLAGGAIFVNTISLGWLFLAGEFPHKPVVIFVVCIPYTVVIEAIVQGWKGRDSFFDAYMWFCGAMVPCVSLTEVQIDGRVTLEPSPENFFMAMPFWAIPLFFHVRRRYLASKVT